MRLLALNLRRKAFRRNVSRPRLLKQIVNNVEDVEVRAAVARQLARAVDGCVRKLTEVRRYDNVLEHGLIASEHFPRAHVSAQLGVSFAP